MKHYSPLTKTVFVLVTTVLVIGFSAFGQKQKSDEYSFRKEQFDKNDTIRKRNRDQSDHDFYKMEEQMRNLEVQMRKLEDQMQKLDMTRFEKEINDKIEKIDFEKINDQIDSSVKSINWEQMNKKLQEHVKVNQLRMQEIKEQLKHSKLNLDRQQINMRLNGEKMKENMEKAMKNAHRSIENAKAEIRNVWEFTDVLQKDGLIDKSKAYKIEVKNGELYINDKKQSKEINEKYKKYYRKSNFTIDMNEGDDFWI